MSARPSWPRRSRETLGARLIRLQCYEGLDESKAIYEWNYKKQLLRIQADREHERDWETVESDIFSEAFLLTRPLLEAIRADEPVVLLIDEVDRVEIETEALLLEVLSDFQVSIPELGTIAGKQIPMVFLTSNNTRELSEALKRRCLFLHIDYPDIEREKEIVRVRVPEVDAALAEQIAKVVNSIRNIDLKKSPSISETIDWARTLGVPRPQRDHARSARRHAARAVEVPERHRQGPQGAGCRRAGGHQEVTTLPTAALPAEPHMLDVLQGFVHELRTAGLPVSMTENLDAMRAIEYVPLDDRASFKAALGATLVKNAGHYRVFDTVFEVFFSMFSPGVNADGESDLDAEAQANFDELRAAMDQGGAMSQVSNEELAQMLLDALMRMDQNEMRMLAGAAVARFAGMEPGRPVGGAYYLYRTLRQLDADGLVTKMMARAQEEEQIGDGAFDERLAREDFEGRLKVLKEMIEAEIRKRLVADRGVEAMARTLRKPLPEDVDFMHASRDEMQMLQRAIYPLTRALAARLAQRRRHRRRGQLDFRQTVRHSMSFGGVPVEPKFKRPRPSKPEIMVVADISGSVASFARFTLQFVYAMQSEFSKVRSWVFIDGIDEVTRFFDESQELSEAIHRVNTEADVVWVDGHSDYGHAFEVFHERHIREVTKKSSVILLGDARNNYHASQAWTVAEMQKRARKVFWLDPEPRGYWDTGDSIVSEYAPYCDGVYEVRNLRQLQKFVADVVEA